MGRDLSTDRDYRNDLRFVTAIAVEARMSLRRKSVSLFPAYLAAHKVELARYQHDGGDCHAKHGQHQIV